MATLPTAAEIKSCYPHYENCPTALVNEKIAEAASSVGPAWGTGARYTRGVMLTTAHLLALTPQGAHMRLKDGTSVYEKELERMRRVVACGLGRVAR